MTEARRPNRRGRSRRSGNRSAADSAAEPNPYRDASPATESPGSDAPPSEGEGREAPGNTASPRDSATPPSANNGSDSSGGEAVSSAGNRPARDGGGGGGGGNRHRPNDRPGFDRSGRRGRRNRGRNQQRRDQTDRTPSTPVTADGETLGWFDPSRDGGFIRRAANSYLADSGDAWVPSHIVRQYGLRRGDALHATTGRDNRNRVSIVELLAINDTAPDESAPRSDFGSLTATYPDRRLTLETGRSAKGGGPELTRRAIDLIAPIGYGQRALIVAPARAGKTMLLHAITEGIAINHPNATLLILLVDERPEEVSEAISWGVGEVVASSFDQPAARHVEVTEMVIERARRLVETGKDVVIVLDSLTRMARAHNTAERGTGRTLSGGLDSQAMAKPKAFFGSARSVADADGGGSITIISTALVETGSRMDDVIFEEFKGTGNCEIKLDRSLAEKRIFPAFDIAASGTRREEKLYKPDQLDAVYTLRRGLQQMPPQAAMEWLIKRIAGTPSNDTLLTGL
jgi:transcription termination factor Rho